MVAIVLHAHPRINRACGRVFTTIKHTKLRNETARPSCSYYNHRITTQGCIAMNVPFVPACFVSQEAFTEAFVAAEENQLSKQDVT